MKVEHSVNVQVELTYVRILINGQLHLDIRRQHLIGIQSYKNGHKSFVIEYEYPKKVITSEYDKKEIWEAILRGLGAQPIF